MTYLRSEQSSGSDLTALPPRRLTWTDITLGAPSTPRGTMALHRSLTSGLCRRAGDPPGVFWGVGDRGPNLGPGDAAELYGLDHLAPLAALDGAKIMPLPEVGPALARFRLEGDAVLLEAVMPLHCPDGTPLDGLPPPFAGAETEPVFGLDGAALPTSVHGADSEGIAARRDGRFWIAEEYGPSLLLAEPDGTVIRRLVPRGSACCFAGSVIPIVATLPPIALARKLNRGFEALAISPDGAVLYVAFQSPLAHPDRAAHDAGNLVRIWALDAESGDFLAEYAYPLDPADSFARDAEAGPVSASDVKVSEMNCLPDGNLLVLERITHSTHFYRVSLGESLPVAFCDPTHRPTLEQVGQAGIHAAGWPLLAKQAVISTDVFSQVCGDLEGLIVLDDGTMLAANDSDYGTAGAQTQFWLWPAGLIAAA